MSCTTDGHDDVPSGTTKSQQQKHIVRLYCSHDIVRLHDQSCRARCTAPSSRHAAHSHRESCMSDVASTVLKRAMYMCLTLHCQSACPSQVLCSIGQLKQSFTACHNSFHYVCRKMLSKFWLLQVGLNACDHCSMSLTYKFIRHLYKHLPALNAAHSSCGMCIYNL